MGTGEPTGPKVYTPYPSPTRFQWVSGGLGASFFPLVYIVAPGSLLVAALALCLAPFHWFTATVWALIFASVALPPIPSVGLLQSWPFKYMPAYFQYSEISEVEDDKVKELMASRRVMFVAQPHGVFTFGGACAVEVPFIKQAVGIFGSCDASSRTLLKTLKQKSCVLYAGGIAELFLTDDLEEKLYVNKRKGFIKVALQSGVAIVPLYIFGNTTTLKVAKGQALVKFARKAGISLTWFWGVWYTFVPFPKKCLVAVGKPMELPQVDNPEQAMIDQYHEQYISEVKRLFDTYKKYNSDYANKELKFAE
eukprot:CAMPEP_0117696540 /NCGR_PEP_ID=MMETSP0804-20121206/28730_1 /TAXON_ID=1074897 /ORGANISM="Tetraselmis astigmatica, Strain CCMP880" /LENGTH=307 /DNA_ID=CAMNT_0005510691 /DNA_START=15 /DNA_END=939 /DNA_ORIENTATION=-